MYQYQEPYTGATFLQIPVKLGACIVERHLSHDRRDFGVCLELMSSGSLGMATYRNSQQPLTG